MQNAKNYVLKTVYHVQENVIGNVLMKGNVRKNVGSYAIDCHAIKDVPKNYHVDIRVLAYVERSVLVKNIVKNVEIPIL